MTVYASVDQADVFAAEKQRRASPVERPTTTDHLDLLSQDIFKVVDDLQAIVTSKLELDPTDVGTMSGKLIILRLLLNAKHSVKTPQVDRNWSGS